MYFNRYLKLSIGFCLLLELIRIAVSNSLHYIFLPWNLLLAYVPLWISSKKFVPQTNSPVNRKGVSRFFHVWKHFFWIAAWFIFLPNAPYLITDLIHLKERHPVPFYFDTVLVFLYAVNGLIFFFVSVSQGEQYWRKKIPSISVNWFFLGAFGGCSFGIYLGRFGRFNSWNVVTDPLDLFYQIADRFLFPLEHPQTWAVTLLFSILLFLLYQLSKYRTSME
jgi:uncharacterized membrane protein